VPAKEQTASEAGELSIDVAIRRLGVRERWEQLRHSDALKDLLEEVALWTAPWTGFALARHIGTAAGPSARAPAQDPNVSRSSRVPGAEWSR
jgi:hypothetical protein